MTENSYASGCAHERYQEVARRVDARPKGLSMFKGLFGGRNFTREEVNEVVDLFRLDDEPCCGMDEDRDHDRAKR